MACCKRKRPNPGRGDDRTLVTSDIMAQLMLAFADLECDCEPLRIQSEPVLSDFVQSELLKIAGKLALAGANAGIVRGVGGDIHRVIEIVALAFQAGYRDLLAGLAPHPANEVTEKELPSGGATE